MSAVPSDLTLAAEAAHAERRENSALVVRTTARYQAVQALKAQEKGIKTIKRELGLAKETVRRFYRASSLEELLAGSAPDSANTGSALHIETDLDQINPADASESNLDYAGPADMPVLANPGDTINYTGKLAITTAPTATTTGAATLVAHTCTFISDGAACTLTGTATLTPSGGTLTGFVSTHQNSGIGDRTVSIGLFWRSQSGHAHGVPPSRLSRVRSSDLVYRADDTAYARRPSKSPTSGPLPPHRRS